MSDDEDYGVNITDEDRIELSMTGEVEVDTDAGLTTISTQSERLIITKPQARMFVEALSQLETDNAVSQETALRTQSKLRQKFDLD